MTRNPPTSTRTPSEARNPVETARIVASPAILGIPNELNRLYTEHEAAHIGAGTVDRSQHEVYRQIRDRSRPGSSSYGQLFSIESTSIESTLVNRADVPRLVRELEARRMIIALPCFQFHADSGWLDVQVYWIARLEQSGVAENNVAQIFVELCELSGKAATEWLRSIEGPEEISGGLLRDLEHNLQPGEAAREGFSPGEMQQWQADSEFVVFFDPERVVKHTRFEHRPSKQVLKEFAENVRRELTRHQVGIDIGEPGFFPYHPGSVIAHFETARDFFEARVIPEYLSDRRIKRRLDQIALQEALHDIEIDRPATARYTRDRAEVLQRTGFRDESKAPGGLAPGQLAAEMILRLSPFVEQHYQDSWRSRCQHFVEEFQQGLRMHGGDHKRMIRFVKPKEFIQQPVEVWTRLIQNPELIHATYESPRGTEQVFALRDSIIFRHLVGVLQKIPPGEHWRIAGFRRLLVATGNMEFARLMKADPDFRAGYERLMRILHGRYVPLFLRWLYWLKLRPVVKYLDRTASRVLNGEELRHLNANQNQIERMRKKERETNRERVLSVRGAAIGTEIVAELQSQYFERMRIPSVAEATSALGQIDRDTLLTLFRKVGFSVLKKSRAPRPAKQGDSDVPARAVVDPETEFFEQGILIFPRDGSYAGRVNQLLHLCRSILSAVQEDGGGVAKFAPDRTQVDRARRLHAFLVQERAKLI